MIKAILKEGRLQPLEPIPAEWADGRELLIRPAGQASAEDVDAWYAELQQLGPAQYDPGERERIGSDLVQAGEQAVRTGRRDS